MTTTPRRQRTVSRTIHIVAGLLLGTIVYSPSYVSAALIPIARFVAIPAVILTGLFLWKQAPIRAWFRGRFGGRRATP